MSEASNPINSVVAATDFSPNGDLAVLRGAHIAQHTGKTLHLLHIVRPLEIYPELMISYDTHVKDYERLKQANGIETLDQLAVSIRNDFKIEVKTAARIGRPHTQIAEYAKATKAGLVVIGSHGQNDFIDAILGSTASRLLRIAPCPILIAKNSAVTAYKEVIAAMDLTDSSINIANYACAVAPQAHIELLHVFNLKQEVLSREVGTNDADINSYRNVAMKHIDDELNDLLTQLDNKRVSSMVINGYLPESICTRAETLNAELVVLGKRGESELQAFILGSVSKAIVNRVACDVFII